jgi:hypothetical protein
MCPVADLSPVLLPVNDIVITIYQQAIAAGVKAEDKDKVHLFVRPADVNALCDIHDIPVEDRPELLHRVLLVQELENKMRWSKA